MDHVVRKKVGLLVCFILVMTTLLCGCSFETMKYIGADKKECKELLDYLSTNNTEGLKSMFCNIISSSENFDEQIQEAIEFFEGNIVSNDSPLTGTDESIHYGKYEVFHNSGHIPNIVTNVDKRYDIQFYSYIVYADDKNREGISELTIKCNDGTECVVGDYYKVSPEDR